MKRFYGEIFADFEKSRDTSPFQNVNRTEAESRCMNRRRQCPAPMNMNLTNALSNGALTITPPPI
jgi:hypothetical protein